MAASTACRPRVAVSNRAGVTHSPCSVAFSAPPSHPFVDRRVSPRPSDFIWCKSWLLLRLGRCGGARSTGGALGSDPQRVTRAEGAGGGGSVRTGAHGQTGRAALPADRRYHIPPGPDP